MITKGRETSRDTVMWRRSSVLHRHWVAHRSPSKSRSLRASRGRSPNRVERFQNLDLLQKSVLKMCTLNFIVECIGKGRYQTGGRVVLKGRNHEV